MANPTPFAPKPAPRPVDPARPYVDFNGNGHATFAEMHAANLAKKSGK